MAKINGSGCDTSLKQILQNMIPDAAELLRGVVISADPLKIRMENDEKLVLNARIAIIPQHLSDFTTTMTLPSGTCAVTFHNALKTGDSVHVLCLNHGKLYYVLDKAVR